MKKKCEKKGLFPLLRVIRCLLGKGFVTYQMNVWYSDAGLSGTFPRDYCCWCCCCGSVAFGSATARGFSVLLKQCKSIEAQEVSLLKRSSIPLPCYILDIFSIWTYSIYGRYSFVACHSFVLSTIVPSLNFSLQRHCSLFSRFHYAGHQPLRVRSGAVTALGLEPPLS